MLKAIQAICRTAVSPVASQKGTSGNPTGRRPGSRNKATLILDALADGEAQAVLEAVLQRAKGGDMQAAALVLSRIWPVPRGRPVAFGLPPIDTPADAAAASAIVLTAVAEGRLMPTEAAAILELVRMHLHILGVVEQRRDADAFSAILEFRSNGASG